MTEVQGRERKKGRRRTKEEETGERRERRLREEKRRVEDREPVTRGGRGEAMTAQGMVVRRVRAGHFALFRGLCPVPLIRCGAEWIYAMRALRVEPPSAGRAWTFRRPFASVDGLRLKWGLGCCPHCGRTPPHHRPSILTYYIWAGPLGANLSFYSVVSGTYHCTPQPQPRAAPIDPFTPP